jgi:diguanylate cyclase (GGDEF)-like protein
MLANAWVAHIEHRTGGVAAARPTPSRLALPVQLLPYGLIGMGTVLMMIHAAEIISLPMLIMGLCMLLVLVRQWVVLRENVRLVAELRASHAIIARARDQAAQEARTDSLTGLPNRRFLDEHLVPLLAYHRRRHLPLSAIFLDIDLFKAVNDRLGHAAGDLALVRLGQCLGETVREGDILARYGGEEFVILLPDTAEPEALVVAERLRRAVAACPLLIGGDSATTLTVSLGVATYPEHGDTTEALLRAADVALYEAKAAGRDRVATPPIRAVRAGALAEIT